jgi:hypothetical protein
VGGSFVPGGGYNIDKHNSIGVGLTIRIKNTSWNFFVESRYNYAASRNVATQVAPVTFGFEYQ